MYFISITPYTKGKKTTPPEFLEINHTFDINIKPILRKNKYLNNLIKIDRLFSILLRADCFT